MGRRHRLRLGGSVLSLAAYLAGLARIEADMAAELAAAGLPRTEEQIGRDLGICVDMMATQIDPSEGGAMMIAPSATGAGSG